MALEAEIAVTGSTGVVGGHVARELADHGVAQRLLVRNPARAPQLPNADVHQFSYSDQAASTAALEGASVLFMVSASESAERLDEHRAFVDAAAAAGVRHVVRGRSPGPRRSHSPATTTSPRGTSRPPG